MKIRRVVINSLLFGTFFASMAFAGEGTRPPMAPMCEPSGRMQGAMENPPLPPMMVNLAELQKLMDEIKIDKSVSSKIITISRSFMKELDSKILKIQREELNIKEELLKEHPDLAAVRSAIGKKTEVLGDIEFSQIKRDLDIKALLTPEEYDLLKSAMHPRMPPMPGALGGHAWPNRKENGNPEPSEHR